MVEVCHVMQGPSLILFASSGGLTKALPSPACMLVPRQLHETCHSL